MKQLLLGMSLALAVGGGAIARTPAFDPRDHKTAIAGDPTQVLVIGSPHLSGLPATFRSHLLEPLLARLAAFEPDIITIEALSGADCEMLQRHPALYGEAHETFCWGTEEARQSTGLSVADAEAAIKSTLSAWPDAPTSQQRRRLAALFLAANDRASAQVQWLRLPKGERHEGDGLNADLVRILERTSGKLNENYDIGSSLAARLGLERVYPTDDHSADAVVADADDGFGLALGEIRKSDAVRRNRADFDARVARLTDGDAVLGFFRHLNSRMHQHSTFEGDFGAAARHSSPGLYGRHYLAWWEARNLRMIANVRAAFGPRPGTRVLVIVGASHKGYFDAYLDMMQDVALVDADAILAP